MYGRRVKQRQRPSRRMFYWLIAEVDNKPILILGGDSEEEAQQKGLEMIGTNFKIKRLPTRNLSAASSMVRGVTLEESHDLRQSVRRQGHEKTLARRRRRHLANKE